MSGKIDAEARALARLAFDLDAAAVGRDDVVRDRQAQARSFADVLGREERIEQLVHVLGLECRGRCRRSQ